MARNITKLDEPVAGDGSDQGVDDSEADAADHRVQDRHLPPRIAGEDAEQVEEPALRAVEGIKQIVGRIERRIGRVDDPRLQLEALEHAVAGQPALRIVEPQDDADQQRAAAEDEQSEVDQQAAEAGGRTGRVESESQGGVPGDGGGRGSIHTPSGPVFYSSSGDNPGPPPVTIPGIRM